MTASQTTESELLFSVAGVARLMNVPKEDVRHAMRRKRLRAEMILLGDKVGVSIPLSAIAEFWSLSPATVQAIETEARQGVLNAPVPVVTPLFTRRIGSGETTEPEAVNRCPEGMPGKWEEPTQELLPSR